MRKRTLCTLLAAAVAFFLLAASPAGAQLNQEQTDYAMGLLQSVSLPIAFIAGVVSILSPCILPLVPAFFAYTFKEKRNITRMTFVFFLGFMLVFVIMGLMAASIGSTILAVQGNVEWVILAAGLLMIAFGLMSLFGRGFSSFIRLKSRPRNDAIGVFTMGIVFAVGWTACVGPVLSAVLVMTGMLGNFAYGGILLAVYSIGIFVPLIAISLLYDRLNLSESRLLKSGPFSFNALGRRVEAHLTNIISGVLFIAIGIVFVVFRSTTIFNDADLLGTKMSFFEIQRAFMGLHLIDYAVAAFALAVVLAAAYMVYRRRKRALQS